MEDAADDAINNAIDNNMMDEEGAYTGAYGPDGILDHPPPPRITKAMAAMADAGIQYNKEILIGAVDNSIQISLPFWLVKKKRMKMGWHTVEKVLKVTERGAYLRIEGGLDEWFPIHYLGVRPKPGRKRDQ